HHRIGCAGGADGAIADPNMFSLRDAGSLYEQIATNLFTAQNKQTLYTLMIDSNENGLPSAVGSIVDDEAASLDLTAQQLGSFKTMLDTVYKGGSYGLCSPDCIYDQTRGGWAKIPFRASCRIAPREFVYGTFVNGASVDADASAAASTAYNELLREQIRAAL